MRYERCQHYTTVPCHRSAVKSVLKTSSDKPLFPASVDQLRASRSVDSYVRKLVSALSDSIEIEGIDRHRQQHRKSARIFNRSYLRNRHDAILSSPE